MPNQKKRARLFVNRTIQGRLLGRTTLYWILYHGVLWMAMFMYRYAEYRGTLLAGATPRTFNNLYGEFVRENFSLWVCSLAILPIVLWDLLCFSHRIVGPLRRFEVALQDLTAGKSVPAVKLREHDLLPELQNAFNAYLQSLSVSQAAGNTESPSLAAAANSRIAAEGSVADDELHEAVLHDLRELQQRLDAIQRTGSDQTSSAPNCSSAEQITS